MALIWCVEHGVFDDATARRLMPTYEAAKKRPKATAAAVAAIASTSGKKVKKEKKEKKKRKHHSSGFADGQDYDPGLSVAGAEGIGSMGL